MSRRARVEEVLEVIGIDDPALLRAMRAEGLFEAEELPIEEADELRVAACLMRDLGVNAAGVEVVLQLRRRLLTLQGRMSVVLRELLEDLESR